MGSSLQKAPAPLAARKHSSRTTSYTTPATSSWPRIRPTLTQYTGRPCTKLVVPSSGSIIQLYSSARSAPSVPSSVMKPASGSTSRSPATSSFSVSLST